MECCPYRTFLTSSANSIVDEAREWTLTGFTLSFNLFYQSHSNFIKTFCFGKATLKWIGSVVLNAKDASEQECPNTGDGHCISCSLHQAGISTAVHLQLRCAWWPGVRCCHRHRVTRQHLQWGKDSLVLLEQWQWLWNICWLIIFSLLPYPKSWLLMIWFAHHLYNLWWFNDLGSLTTKHLRPQAARVGCECWQVPLTCVGSCPPCANKLCQISNRPALLVGLVVSTVLLLNRDKSKRLGNIVVFPYFWEVTPITSIN